MHCIRHDHWNLTDGTATPFSCWDGAKVPTKEPIGLPDRNI